MSNDTTKPKFPVSGGYISLVVHIWTDKDGKLIRGTVEDAHTRTRVAIDISALASLLRESLSHAHDQ